MRRVRPILALTQVLVCVICIGCITQAQPPEIPQEAQAALQYLLDLDHEDVVKDVGKQREGAVQALPDQKAAQAMTKLKKFAQEVEPQLIAILRDGPDPQKTLPQVQRSLEKQWARREAFLKKSPKLGLKEDDLKIARSMTQDDYVKGGLERFTRKYRENAVVMLAAIGSEEGKRELLAAKKAAIQRGDKVFQKVIEAALAQDKDTQPPATPGGLKVLP